MQETKYCIEDAEAVALCDSAKNCSSTVQGTAQGFHWNNQQAATHPFVCYFKNSNPVVEFLHLSCTVVSNCLTHDTAAVYI
jgi:hypothetical protein